MSSSGHACVLGPKTRVSGILSGRQDMIVRGFVEGRILLRGELFVAPQGTLRAKLDVDRAVVAGEVEGEIEAKEHLKIESGAQVRGRLTAPSLAIDPGALVFGEVLMEVELPAELDALTS